MKCAHGYDESKRCKQCKAEHNTLRTERRKLREEIAFLKRFSDAPDMKTGKTTRDALLEEIALLKGQLPPLTDVMYHAVRGLELNQGRPK